MVSTVSAFPVPVGSSVSQSTATTNNGTNLTKDDFLKILLAEMSTPNFGNLFGSSSNTNSSSSLFGGNSLSSSLLQMNNLTSLADTASATSLTELPLLSLLIGKEIKGLDADKNEVSGMVQRILMQNGVAMVDIGDSGMVSPSSITEVK